MARLRRRCAPARHVQLGTLAPVDALETRIPVAGIRPGASPLVDLFALGALARYKAPQKVFEIGTFEGMGAVTLSWNSPDDAVVHTLDLPYDADVVRSGRSGKAQSVGPDYESGILVDRFACRNVERHVGDSALFDFSPHEGEIDLFFVDGSHQTDYVRNDTAKAVRCCRPDGWIVWHDALNSQVHTVVREVARHTQVFLVADTRLAVAVGNIGTKHVRGWESTR